MKNRGTLRILLPIALVIAVIGPTAYAQQGGGSGSRRLRYNPATEVTVKGTVQEVKEQVGRMGWPGTHLTLKTGQEMLDIHLGPSDYLAKEKFSFSKGDEVEVTGSKVKYQGADALLAREVKKGDKVLTLRDAQGVPQWSRGRRP